MGDGFATERHRQAERRKALDWLASREVPTLASDQLFRTYSQGAYPTTVGKVHACHPCEISNVEAEGETGTISEDTTATCYVLNLGPQVPAVGDYLDADSIDGRWVANFFKGCGSIRVTVKICVSPGVVNLLSGATVTIKDSPGATVGSPCTTDATGICEIAIPSAGDYTIVVAKSGQITVTKPIAATCTVNAVDVVMNQGIFVGVFGCGCGIEGASVTLTQTVGGTYSATMLTDATGRATFSFNPVAGTTYQYTIAPVSLYNSLAGPVTVGPLGTICKIEPGSTLSSVSGYWCYGGAPPICRDPIPSNLFVTLGPEAFYGTAAGTTVTVPHTTGTTFALSGIAIGGGNTMTLTITFPANGTCVTPTIQVAASKPGASANMTTITSGTAGCPVACGVQTAGGALNPASCTISE